MPDTTVTDRPTAEGDVIAPADPDAPRDAVEEFLHPADAAEPVDPEALEDQYGVTDKPVTLTTPRGALTIDPGQERFTAVQRATLHAIGINPDEDPRVIPHARVFMHLCQTRGLDPFAKEAYLIARGRGDDRTWTMQTGIDGYRKMAGRTGRLLGVRARLWSGADDTDRWWSMVTDQFGDLVRKRVYTDAWLPQWGDPALSKVHVAHLNGQGQETITTAVGNWDMYAPYKDVWEGPRGARRKVTAPDGSPVRELTGLWADGGPHMLAKCVEALAYRLALPDTVNGFYTHEEMQVVHARARDAAASRPQALAVDRVAEQRRETVSIGDAVARTAAAAQQHLTPAPDTLPPTPLGGDWRDEFKWCASILDRTVDDMLRRPAQMMSAPDVRAWGDEQAYRALGMVRGTVANRLDENGYGDVADVYRAAPSGQTVDVAVLTDWLDNGMPPRRGDATDASGDGGDVVDADLVDDPEVPVDAR